VVVGQTVTAQGVFGNGSRRAVGVSEGPWFASIRSEDEPTTASIPLGRVLITRSNGTLCCWRASVTFMVPKVPTGGYVISVQNADGAGVGDLTGGWTVIAHTRQEGHLFFELREATLRLSVRDRTIGTLRSREQQLRADLADREGTIDRQTERLTDVGARAGRLEADLALARRQLPPWPFVLAGVGSLMLAAAAYALGRRRALRHADAGDRRQPLVHGEPGGAGIS
jgi:hypothetical protein